MRVTLATKVGQGSPASVRAGRAAAMGLPEIAIGLLDEIIAPPPGQAWRIEATRAIALLVQGNEEEGVILRLLLHFLLADAEKAEKKVEAEKTRARAAS